MAYCSKCKGEHVRGHRRSGQSAHDRWHARNPRADFFWHCGGWAHKHSQKGTTWLYARGDRKSGPLPGPMERIDELDT